MFRVYSYILVFYLLFLSRWAKLDIVVSHESTKEGEITNTIHDDQVILPSVGTEIFVDNSLNKELLPQEPQVIVAKDETSSEISLDMGARRTGATEDIDNVRGMDSTLQSVSFVADTTRMNEVTRTNIPSNGVDKTREEDSARSPTESSQETMKSEAIASSDLSPVSTSTPAKEPPDLEPHLPALNKILEDALHTQPSDPDKLQSSHRIPSPEGSSHTFDILEPTEALKSVTLVPSDEMSKLPEEMKEKIPDIKVKDDAIFQTQFSLDEEVGVKPPSEEEFPTFDKWSMQYLAEQEKQKVKHQQKQAVNPNTLLVQKKLKRNFAAKSCGAKVVASNPEAENVDFVLNKNPDEYMLSPCKAKKWFVVELCEPLQIHKVDIGTTELFASQPKSFRISTSQRFPTKEWTPLGKFDMTSDRSIQSFSTQVNEEFIKFVRVEMLEHHGDEYYCPITTFRVLGVDMASDDDEHNNEVLDSSDETAVVNNEEDEVEESVNLFTSAKDAVVKLVKKVLFKDENVKDEHAVVDNKTVKSEEKKGDTAPCSEKISATLADTPSAHIPEAGIISKQPVAEETREVPIVTKLADTEQLPFVTIETPVVIKLEKDTDNTGQDCLMSDTPSLCACSSWNPYLKILSYVSRQASTCPASSTSNTEVIQESPSIIDRTSTDTSIDQTATVMPDQEVPIQKPQSEQKTFTEGDQPGKEDLLQKDLSEKEHLSSSSSQKLQPEISGKVVSTQAFQQKQSEDPVVASHLTSFSSSEVTVTKSDSLDPSSLLGQTQMVDVSMPMMTPDLDIQQSQVVEQGTNNLVETMFLKVSPTPTLTSEDSLVVDEDILHEPPTAQQSAQVKGEELMSEPPENIQGRFDSAPEQVKSEVTDKNVSSTTGGKTSRSMDLIDVAMSSSSKRDISFMKLSNRIMALEQNVSMTKKYLEELSRAFKQQNEDMMKLLNKTEKRLNSYIGQSEERDLRQQTTIDSLEVKVANLTQALDSMQHQMNVLSKELRGTQFLLAVFQAILFLWLIISSYRSCSKPSLVYTDHQFLLDTMPTKPSIDRADKRSLQRRNSDVGITSGGEQGGTFLKRQVSEANLASYGGSKHQSDGTSLLIRDPNQVTKKRKKKRLKNPQLSLDSVHSLSMRHSNGEIPAQSSSFSSSAGVLFGTNKMYHLTDNTVGQEPALDMTRELINRSNIQCQLNNISKKPSFIGYASQPAGPVPATKHGILVKKEPDSFNVTNSTSIKMTDKSNLQWSEPVSITNRIPVVHFNRHQEIPDTGLSKTPPSSTQEQMQMPSPEFKLPFYHKNKIRKLSEANSSTHHGWEANKNINGRTLGGKCFKRRASAGLIGPEVSNGCFFTENYLSENRFKFPASPSSSVSELKVSSNVKAVDLNTLRLTSNDCHLEENNVKHSEQPDIKSTLYKGAQHHSSLSSLSSSSSSRGSSLSCSLQTGTVTPVQPITSQASFICSQYIPAHVSSRQLSSTGYSCVHDHPAQPDCVSLETGPIISSNISITDNAHKFNTNHQSSHIKIPSQFQWKAGPISTDEASKSHRRQGSLPTNQFHSNKSLDKPSPPAMRKGSFEESKQLRKSTPAILKGGAKLKRVTTNTTNKHNLGGKASSTDSSTQVPSKKAS